VLGKPALSFSDNPAFARLVAGTIRAQRIVVLCGAGVTADAGLPTWPLLLTRIAKQRAARRDALAPLVPANEADLARAAGLLLRRPGRGRSPDYAAVAAALYDDQPPLPSTYLAQRIIDFVAARGPRTIALATTNYDDLLEAAARASELRPQPCSLDGAEPWWEAFARPVDPWLPIYHLHGYLGRDPEAVLGPIVVTEDQFHREGARVQAHLRRMIVEADLVLCVGVGLTDANLVGALASLPPADDPAGDPGHAGKVFVVSVAGPVADSANPAQAERYAAERGAYLHDVFGVDVVPLNGYGQVGQLMIELELAVSEPERYLEADGATGLRYGFRLAQGLEAAYRAVGWPTDGSAPTGEQLAAASDALDGVLRSIRPDLAQVVLRSEHEALLALGEDLRSAPDLQTHVGREGLGLFLWMPTPFTPHGHPSPRGYSLQLVAASTHAHRAYWSFRRKPIAVNAYSVDPAARAAFSGQPVVAPAPSGDEPGLWRTVVAVPLSAVPAPGRGSTIALGAVVLASDRGLPTAEEGVAGPLADERLAGVAYLSPAEVAEYCRIVLDGVSALLAPPP
jgi:hypothetical protein